eukprot:scaffold15279_cov37-Attheya_sp.AAC.6
MPVCLAVYTSMHCRPTPNRHLFTIRQASHLHPTHFTSHPSSAATCLSPMLPVTRHAVSLGFASTGASPSSLAPSTSSQSYVNIAPAL